MSFLEKQRPAIKLFVPSKSTSDDIDSTNTSMARGGIGGSNSSVSGVCVSGSGSGSGSGRSSGRSSGGLDNDIILYTGIPRNFREDNSQRKSVAKISMGQGISLDERKRIREERIQEKKEKKNKCEEIIPTREEITHVAFTLFNKYEFITLVDLMRCMELSQDSNKAKTAVKNVLRELALYETSGPNKRKYRLRDMFKIKKSSDNSLENKEEEEFEWEFE